MKNYTKVIYQTNSSKHNIQQKSTGVNDNDAKKKCEMNG